MLRSFSVKNFRGFASLDLTSLSSINLILGPNNIGKTSILEALFLFSGRHNPQLPTNLSAFRGVKQLASQGGVLWGPLFHNIDTSQIIDMEAVDHEDIGLSLRISLSESLEPIQLIPGSGNGDLDKESASASTTISTSVKSYLEELTLVAREGTSEFKSVARLKPDGIELKQERRQSKSGAIFVPAHATPFHPNTVQRYSTLERKSATAELLEALRIIEPRLKKFAVLTESGEPVVYGDIGLPELLPIYFMGEGMGRLFELVVDITAIEKGTVLIDEINAGIHYKAMPHIWKAVADIVEKSGGQLFATTHSRECVVAAHQAVPSNLLRVHRLEASKEGIQAITYEPSALDVAIESDLEMR